MIIQRHQLWFFVTLLRYATCGDEFSTTGVTVPDPNWPYLKNHQKTKQDKPYHVKRILAFGDALTDGYTKHGRQFSPYATKLEELLNTHAQRVRYDVITDSVPTECAHTELNTRLPHSLAKYKPDIVIILAGMNDLRKLDCLKKVNLFHEIAVLHEKAHARGIQTVAVTLPEAKETDSSLAAYGKKTYKAILRDVNNKIRKYAAEKKLTLLCDLAKHFPSRSKDKGRRVKYWDDRRHMTKRGYDKMAELIFDVLLKITWDQT